MSSVELKEQNATPIFVTKDCSTTEATVSCVFPVKDQAYLNKLLPKSVTIPEKARTSLSRVALALDIPLGTMLNMD